MNKMLIVAAHELRAAVMTKGFWVQLLIVPLMITLTTWLPRVIQRQQPTVYAIIDQARDVAPPMIEILDRPPQQLAQSDPPPPSLRVPALPAIDMDQQPATLVEALRPYFRGEIKVDTDAGPRTLGAAIVIPKEFGEPSAPVEIVSVNVVPGGFVSQVRGALTQILRARALEAKGIDPQLVAQVQNMTAPVMTVSPDQQNRQRNSGAMALLGPFGLCFLLVMSAFTGGARLLNSMIEERANKLVEVILSSVTADQLMIGKLAGNALVGLIVVVGWVGAGLALAHSAGAGNDVITTFANLLTAKIMVAFVVYFLAAYIMYAALFLAVGSTVNSVQDAQAYMMPLTMMTVLPLALLGPAVTNPNGPIVVVLSWIPLYTPIGMMMRLPTDPPLWEIFGSGTLMVAFIVALIWFLARLFRVSVLAAGGSISGAQLWRVLRGKTL